jgi:hypothetical protein
MYSNKLAFLVLSAVATVGGCASNVNDNDNDNDEQLTEASTDALTDVTHSAVKRQSIGNCWMYATMSWAESLHKRVAGEELNLSESYSSYWYWFEQIANGGLDGDAISTGGWFRSATDLFMRYGVMKEADFIPEEASIEMSGRQKTALDAINVSLKSGLLKDPANRRNREVVRAELNRAWALNASVVSQMDTVFGTRVVRTLDRSTVSTRGTGILRARDISVKTTDSQTMQLATVTLADAIGVKSSQGRGWGSRSGRYAWQEASYPSSATARRETQIRMQRALHDANPVVMSWFVDFNALDAQGRFFAPPASPGRQGGHMVALEDYEVDNVPGFGTLKVGELETRPEALKAALSPQAKIKLIRVKNSWGSVRPDRQFALPGYHDLYMSYLEGNVKHCQERADGTTDTSNCYDDTPLNDLVLPAGY